MKFRKKPVVIEAIKIDITVTGRSELKQWLLENVGDRAAILRQDGSVLIRTLEGDMKGNHGDWIIKGVQGEIYPCKDEIFTMTYEPDTW